jgi:sugar/nucleoside kinase (ribokinase family)
MLLSTLAAAYAETGDFDEAIDLEQQASGLASQQGNARLAAALSDRLTLFQAKIPIRQP